jgi:hypothetical protein
MLLLSCASVRTVGLRCATSSLTVDALLQFQRYVVNLVMSPETRTRDKFPVLILLSTGLLNILLGDGMTDMHSILGAPVPVKEPRQGEVCSKISWSLLCLRLCFVSWI